MATNSKAVQKKADKKREGVRTRNWGLVMYPDSCPPNYIEILNDTHTPYLISPLHNKDVNADGKHKKDHWHLLLMFSSVKTAEQVQEIADKLHTPPPEKIANLKGAVRYLDHRDNPEKAQYNSKDIVAGNGASYIDLCESEMDVRDAFVGMVQLIKERDIRDFDVLLDLLIEEGRMDWLYIATEKRTLAITKYIDSRWKRINNAIAKAMNRV